ncbi:MAG: adenylate/guanylate cyclase domain-containing protein [Deltaproteobacteria bacterium]|nr:adenylate/guanylate cyclase domain-containing protein [Deltaproteobacteria bacterium]
MAANELTIAQLLAQHPWPAPWASEKHVERLWVYDLPGKPEALWPFISDTSRMNRALGTAEMTFSERDGKRYGTAKPGGVRHEWQEVPWNWVANQWLTSLRVYERGFFKAIWSIHLLEEIPTGTRYYVYFGTVPRSALSTAAIRLGFPSIKRAYDRVLPALATQLDRARPAVLQLPPPALTDAAAERLRTQREALVARGLPPACVDALVDWIRTGDDADLHRIQVRERARVWKLPEKDLLRVALHATRAGLLALSWDTVCPHCRGVRDENKSLQDLQAESHCEVCRIDFKTDTQESVEVTFRVHPSIRDIPVVLYCSAEPARKDHIRVQWTVRPGEKVELVPRLAPGRYTVWRERRGGWYLDVDADEHDGEEHVRWVAHPEGHVVKARAGATFEIVHDDKIDGTYTIERATWSDHALRAGQLLGLQEFRDLFSEDYIGANVQLAVGEQTLLFTDVVGSTAFYASRGDPAAFIEIKRHFDEVFAIVAEFRGAVVKTIGDAVMATFIDPVDSLRASKKIHEAFHPRREDTPIRLRISLNTGPCIAVRLNANADFFGGTVNVAAKLQALAESYQIAMSDDTYNGPGVAAYLAEQNADLEALEYASKALKAPVGVRRWTLFRE